MSYRLEKAVSEQIPRIWEILQQAIRRRKEEGSRQWQDGYPNEEVVRKDIEKGVGYVLVDENDTIAGYIAILVSDEPAYDGIEGKWLSNGDFLVVHRVAISDAGLGKGLAQKLLQLTEETAIQKGIFSVKLDTNFDNAPMLYILDKMGYTYCGEVFFRGAARMAFEKVLRN